MTEINEKVSNIVYRYTMLDSGSVRRYISFNELITLTKWLKKASFTSRYITITPFYVNGRIGRQIEFDENMFYLKFSKSIDSEMLVQHWSTDLSSNFEDASFEEQMKVKLLNPICLEGDIDTFSKALDQYISYLGVELPILLELAKKYLNMSKEDLAFGNFCFEIQSQ